MSKLNDGCTMLATEAMIAKNDFYFAACQRQREVTTQTTVEIRNPLLKLMIIRYLFTKTILGATEIKTGYK